MDRAGGPEGVACEVDGEVDEAEAEGAVIRGTRLVARTTSARKSTRPEAIAGVTDQTAAAETTRPTNNLETTSAAITPKVVAVAAAVVVEAAEVIDEATAKNEARARATNGAVTGTSPSRVDQGRLGRQERQVRVVSKRKCLRIRGRTA